MKRIILEGPDGAGKTTLLQKLMEQFHSLELAPKSSPMDEIESWILNVLAAPPAPGHIWVHDRLYYSELVYGDILRGEIRVSAASQKLIRQQLRESALLIYCRPDWAVLQEGSKVEEQLEGVHTNLGKIVAKYDSIMFQEARAYHHNRFVQYNWKQRYSLGEVVALVDFYLANPIPVKIP